MEQQIHDTGSVLHQMSTFNFDNPIKVTLLLEEEEENDEFYINAHSCPSTTELNRKNSKQQKQSTYKNWFSDAYLDMEENTTINSGSKEARVTRNHLWNYQNVSHNSESTCTAININGSFENQMEFEIETVVKNNITTIEEQNSQPSYLIHSTERDNIIRLLDKVSNNLIEISKMYHDFFSCNHNREYFETEKFWTTYLQFKFHYFQHSYNTVVSLPFEKNETFIEKFIDRTIILAHNKSLYNISKEYLYNLIKDMINWTRQKKKVLELEIDNQNKIRSSINNICISNQPKIKENNKMCNYSFGPENNKVTISVDSKMLTNINSNIVGEPEESLNDRSQYQSSIYPDASNNCVVYPTLAAGLKTNAQDIKTSSVLSIATHIKKMNTRADTVASVCKVCCLKRNTICVGYHQEYYCSPKCQRKDRPCHRFLCRR